MDVRVWSVLPAATLALVFMGPARDMRADTVFSNFGPSQTYVGNKWWDVGATTTPPGAQVDAFSFAPSETATLTGADLALSALGSVTPLTVYVESSSGGAPGTILDTLTQTGSYSTYPVTDVVNFTCSGSCSTLDAGSTYWLVAQQTDPANSSYWMYSFGDTGAWYYNDTDSATGQWTAATAGDSFSAFDVTGTASNVPPVPEPGSVALLGSGLVLVGFLEVRRRAWLAKRGDRDRFEP